MSGPPNTIRKSTTVATSVVCAGLSAFLVRGCGRMATVVDDVARVGRRVAAQGDDLARMGTRSDDLFMSGADDVAPTPSVRSFGGDIAEEALQQGLDFATFPDSDLDGSGSIDVASPQLDAFSGLRRLAGGHSADKSVLISAGSLVLAIDAVRSHDGLILITNTSEPELSDVIISVNGTWRFVASREKAAIVRSRALSTMWKPDGKVIHITMSDRESGVMMVPSASGWKMTRPMDVIAVLRKLNIQPAVLPGNVPVPR